MYIDSIHSLVMKATLPILVLLVTLPVRQKDACSTTGKKATTGTGEKQRADYYLAVIGGGAQAAAVLARLSRSILKAIRLVIIETKATFATGVPYDPDIATPVHLLNYFSPESVSITGDKEDFTKWIKKWKNRKYAGVLKEYKKAVEAGTPPQPIQRILIGRYPSDRFHDFVKKCKGKKYKVDLMNGTTAEKISTHPDGIGYVITLDKGTPIHAHNVFLATGHFYRSRFDDPPKGYYKSPWPSSDLLDEVTGVKEEHIGSLGNSLTAVDGLLTVAHKFGNFNADNTVYETFSNPSNFKMTMYSRDGHLPMVFRYGRELHRPHHMAISKVRDSDGRQFDSAFRFLKNDIADLLPNIAAKENVDVMKAKVFFQHLHTDMKRMSDPKKNFMDDVENKLSELHVKLRSVFSHADGVFMLILGHMSAEEFAIYKKYIQPRTKKASTYIPMINAKKLLALMKKGHLFLEAVGDDAKITEKGDGQGVDVEYGDHEPIPHNYFIEATGQNGYIRMDNRNLTQSLLDSGLAQPYLFKFEDQDYAKELSNGRKDENFDPKRIVKDVVDEKFYYEGDGVIMDFETMRVTPRPDISTQGSIYAGAPFTFTYAPGVQILRFAVKFASVAVEDMEAGAST